jgi:hypothetical protein
MRYFVTPGLCLALLPNVVVGSVVPASRAQATGWRRASFFGRVVGGALLLAVVLASVLLLGPFAARADAQPRIKVNCKVYATNVVDPIAGTTHQHNQIGNTSTTSSSTGSSLFNNRSTSCNQSWFTSAGWFPVERNEAVKGVNVYYRAPGDQKTIKAIPMGLQLLAAGQTSELKYSCGGDTSLSPTPPYSCKTTWATLVVFPDCIDNRALTDPKILANEATNAVNSRNGVCPSGHTYRIPKISFVVMHPDGGVTNPLQVSAGTNTWMDYTFMHADYFAANQSVFDNELLDLCLRNASDSVTVADTRCGR